MKIQIEDSLILFFPENDYELFKLAQIKFLYTQVNFTPNKKIESFKVSIPELCEYLFKKDELYNS